MRTIRTKVYQFEELSEKAQTKAIEEVRMSYEKENDFVIWAIDNCYLFEPKDEEIRPLVGKNYENPIFKNTRKNIYFDTEARYRFLDIEEALEITNHRFFLNWLGITDVFLYEKILFKIYTPKFNYSSTVIEFEFDLDFDKPTLEELEIIETATKKFSNHIDNILKRIEEAIDYSSTDEAIKANILANEWEFLSNGKRY